MALNFLLRQQPIVLVLNKIWSREEVDKQTKMPECHQEWSTLKQESLTIDTETSSLIQQSHLRFFFQSLEQHKTVNYSANHSLLYSVFLI